MTSEPSKRAKALFPTLNPTQFWSAALKGESIDWSQIFEGYTATVDWPPSSFWYYTTSQVIWMGQIFKRLRHSDLPAQ